MLHLYWIYCENHGMQEDIAPLLFLEFRRSQVRAHNAYTHHELSRATRENLQSHNPAKHRGRYGKARPSMRAETRPP